MTTKGSWESYTVEKGCKKISYCKAAVANKPDWTNAWNFCCDRSRCNVKLGMETLQPLQCEARYKKHCSRCNVKLGMENAAAAAM